MKLTSTLKSLITEAAALDQVVDAIKQRKKISIKDFNFLNMS